MQSFNSCLLRNLQEELCSEHQITGNSTDGEALLIRHIGSKASENANIGEISEADCRLILRISNELFLRPTRSSVDIAHEYGLQREQLVRLYRIIRNVRKIQDVLTFDSTQRRRISFMHKELLPDNLPIIKAMFRGDVCLPNHVEFHPALFCNLRCRACPNCHSDNDGEWHFLGYPELGQPLDKERLRMIQDMFLDLGVESFSFGGGGEPTLSELTVGAIGNLRKGSSTAYIALYSNGIFPETWGDVEFKTLVGSLNKLRFSIDSANAQEWSQYKGRPPEFFEILWQNIGKVVAARNRKSGITNLGASCIVSSFTYRNLLTILMTSCFDNKINFEKDYYEKTTRIKFPENYKVLETFDNGEFLTGTVFQMDSLTLQDFIKANHFDTVSNYLDTHIMSENYLTKNKPIFISTHNVYFIRKSEQKINWTYIADLNSKRLWTEISYPDWGGK